MSVTESGERHLLVVDDDDRIRDLLKEYLARNGFRVTAAPGGPAARRLMETLDFDLAVFDVMMPGESGFELTKWLRDRKGAAGRTPVLMLTARGQAFEASISERLRSQLTRAYRSGGLDGVAGARAILAAMAGGRTRSPTPGGGRP